jgi:hypothetical protein
MFFRFASPQTAKYIRWRYTSTFAGNPEIGEVRLSNIVEQDAGDPEEPPIADDFPSASIVDTLNRADGAIGGNWINGITSTGTCVISGNAATFGVDEGNCYYNVLNAGPSVEAYGSLPAGSSHSDGANMWIHTCIQQTGIGTTGADSYAIRIRKDAGTNNDLFVLQKMVNDVFTSLGGESDIDFENGYKFGIRVYEDGTIRGYMYTGTNWQLIQERFDPVSGGGLPCTNTYSGMEMRHTTQKIDDFGTGTFSAGSSLIVVPTMIFMD